MRTNEMRRSAIHRPPPSLTPQEIIQGTRTIVDIRPQEAYVKAHMGGALHIPDSDTGRLIEAVCRDAKAVLVCDDGRVSANVVRMLGVCGYTEVSHLKGGLNAWAGLNLPLMETTSRGEREATPNHRRESAGIVGRILGLLSPQIMYAGLAGGAALLGGITLTLLA